ncbi:hypothetical protein [Paenirhodobacter enshiensis]|uniref:hypothetical protein n=1 Tax=Paenirhodobacter enshiensis TaxID=1105367 RepID=UPI0035B406EE
MSIHDAMFSACEAVGIAPPRATKPGQWVKCPVIGKSRVNGSGRVMMFDDGKGGIAWNWITGAQQRFRADGLAGAGEVRAPRRDMDAERRLQQERAEVARICGVIVRACRVEHHAYLERKGFPDEAGLVIDDPRPMIPDHGLGRAIVRALPEGDGPWLIVPGRIGRDITMIQIIAADGAKKNILHGVMSGASHRIAVGRETWVCEGIATALTVRAALRALGRSATVLSAFSASNVSKVASAIPGALVAADNDRPLDQLHGKGTGEFHAAASGRRWTMPPDLGDFNDMHTRDGLRAVSLHLRAFGMG